VPRRWRALKQTFGYWVAIYSATVDEHSLTDLALLGELWNATPTTSCCCTTALACAMAFRPGGGAEAGSIHSAASHRRASSFPGRVKVIKFIRSAYRSARSSLEATVRLAMRVSTKISGRRQSSGAKATTSDLRLTWYKSLACWDVVPGALSVLEITETSLMADPERGQ